MARLACRNPNLDDPPLSTANILRFADEMWGQRLENNTWTGLTGMLGRGEGDIGIANLFVNNVLGRIQHLEYSSPYTYTVSYPAPYILFCSLTNSTGMHFL